MKPPFPLFSLSLAGGEPGWAWSALPADESARGVWMAWQIVA